MRKELIYNFTPDGTCVECCPNCGGEIEECRQDGTTTCPLEEDEWSEWNNLKSQEVKVTLMCEQKNVLPCSDCKLKDFGFEVQREDYLSPEDQSFIRSLFPSEPDSMICCDWDKGTGCTVFPKEAV